MNDKYIKKNRLNVYESEYNRLFCSEKAQQLSNCGFTKRDIEQLIETKMAIEKIRSLFGCGPFSDVVAFVQRFKDAGYSDEQTALINVFVLQDVY